MSSSSHYEKDLELRNDLEKVEDVDFVKDSANGHNLDAEFGGTEARKKLERKLLRKIDLRMSILILIYILNYVSLAASSLAISITLTKRRIEGGP